ncbi:hypothetical protein BDQ17DRAFT_1332221 [Cyathus striatus]|nr:hypothetical protein BDQ17DRAFT_1332221 [Cyathus striatus]
MANNFVIKNGVFIENAKIYAKKLYPKPSSRSRYTDNSNSITTNFIRKTLNFGQINLLMNVLIKYRQLRTGDINILNRIDRPMQDGYTSNDFVVEVSGESRKKVARIYNGQRGYADGIHAYLVLDTSLTSDLEVGIRRRHGEYMLSLQPLQRVAFVIKYISDYIDTFKYFGQYINSISESYDFEFKFGNVLDRLKVNSEENLGAIHFYVDSSGRLNTVLSKISGILRGLRNLSRSDLELINAILNDDKFVSRPSLCGRDATPIVFITIPIEFATYLVIPELFRKLQFMVLLLKLFHRNVLHEYQYTRFKLKMDAITLGNIDHCKISFRGFCSISENSYQSWLHEAPKILETYHAIIHDNHAINLLGIVSGVEIIIKIDISLSPLIRYMDSSKAGAGVYFYISNPRIDLWMEGFLNRIFIGHWTSQELATFGIFCSIERTLQCKHKPSSNNSLLDKFYYEALYDLYKPSEPFKLNKKEQLRNSSPYIEDIDIDYIKSRHELKKCREMKYFYGKNGLDPL